MSFVDPSSIVPLFDPATSRNLFLQGRLTAWDGATHANTVTITGFDRTNLPVLASAVATLTAPSTVLLIPFGATYLIAGAILQP